MEEIIDITECCICTEMFTDPRMLPCIHTFCLKCLEATRTSSENNSGDTMPCPICRQQFTIPPDGLSCLKRNFFMERLMEIAKLSKPPETKVSCDVCLRSRDESDAQVPDASKYCVECQENMCESCSVQHCRQKLLIDHQIVPFGSQVKDEWVKTFEATYCGQHNKDELRMYCANCETVVCIMCFAECHQQHKCSDVAKAAEGFSSEIDIVLEKAGDFLKNGLEKNQKLEAIKSKFLEELKTAEDAITERANNLKQFIDKHAKVLLDELAQIKATRMKETEIEKEDIERHLTIFNSFNMYCSELRSKGTPVDICRSVDDLLNRAKELEEVNAKKIKQSPIVLEVSLKTSSIEDMLKNENIVGNLQLKKMTERPLASIDVIKTFEYSSDTHIEAVTKLDGRIYILYNYSFQDGITLCTYEDRAPFRCYKDVRIKQIKWDLQVASSDKFRCLYIWDSRNRCVWKLMANDLKVTKWLSNLDGLITLSTSSDGFLMVLRDDKGVKILETYGSDAKNSRYFSFSSHLRNPIHFVQEANGKFIIIHESDESENSSLVITEFGYGGQMRRQIKTKEKHQELTNPFYLSMDSEYELFVAEYINSNLNLVIFDVVSLEWKEMLLISDVRLYQPSLHYDSHKKQFSLFARRSNKVVFYQLHFDKCSSVDCML